MKLESKLVRNGISVLLGLTTLFHTSLNKASEVYETNIPSYFTSRLSNIGFPLGREEILVPTPELISLYTDCDQKSYRGRKPTLKKTPAEVLEGVRKRRGLEEKWTRYFHEQITASYAMRDIDTTKKWFNPLEGVKNYFRNGFRDTRIRAGRWREPHHAIDIMAKTGSPIQTPISGVVIASADDWKGSWSKRGGLRHIKGGLGELSGNGIMLFSPLDTGYYFMIHMKKVYVKAGDVVSRGEVVGNVGITGNAMSPLVPKHLHLAYKKPGKACGIEGVLVSQNPYYRLAEVPNRQLAKKNTVRHEKKFEGSSY